jgi:hypothetical protein
MSDVLGKAPVLSCAQSLAPVRQGIGAEVCQRALRSLRVWSAKRIPTFGVEKIVKQPVRDVEIVCEGEDAVPVVWLVTARREQSTKQHRGLDRR